MMIGTIAIVINVQNAKDRQTPKLFLYTCTAILYKAKQNTL